MAGDRTRELDELVEFVRARGARGVGRVERSLNEQLRERPDVGPAARAGLRAQARAVDVAEALADPHSVTEATNGYLAWCDANGLTAGPAPPSDAFADFLAELSRPAAGVHDPPEH
jgi:hypothetical protein